MLAFAILVIAVCVVVILKANRVLSESGLSDGEVDDLLQEFTRSQDWEFPPRWDRSSRTGDR